MMDQYTIMLLTIWNGGMWLIQVKCRKKKKVNDKTVDGTWGFPDMRLEQILISSWPRDQIEWKFNRIVERKNCKNLHLNKFLQ